METNGKPPKPDKTLESLKALPIMAIRPAIAGGLAAFGANQAFDLNISVMAAAALFVSAAFGYAHWDEHLRGKLKGRGTGLPSMNGWQHKKGYFASGVDSMKNIILFNGNAFLRDDYKPRVSNGEKALRCLDKVLGVQSIRRLQSQLAPHSPIATPQRISGTASDRTTNKVMFVANGMQIPDTVVLRMLRVSWQKEAEKGKYSGLSNRSWVVSHSQFDWWPEQLRKEWYNAILILLAEASRLLGLQLVFERKSGKELKGRKLIVRPSVAYYAIFYSQCFSGAIRDNSDFWAKKLINQGATLPR